MKVKNLNKKLSKLSIISDMHDKVRTRQAFRFYKSFETIGNYIEFNYRSNLNYEVTNDSFTYTSNNTNNIVGYDLGTWSPIGTYTI